MAVQLIYEKNEPKGPDIKNRIKTDVLLTTVNCEMVVAS
jgi:hypothetical protein